MRELGDRSLEDIDRDVLYQRLGVSDPVRSRLQWTLMLLPIATATLLAATSALILTHTGFLVSVTDGDLVTPVIVALVSIGMSLGAIAVAIPVRRAAAAFSAEPPR